MASKKKGTGTRAAIKRMKAEAAEKRAKAAGSGNTALDRANAVAKKGAKVAKTIVSKAKDAATTGRAKPQFFGRPKVKKQVDPEKLKAERNAQHERMMRVDWYAKHRAESIALWVARRAAQAAGDTAEVEKINRKLDRINKERDTARAEWKEKGSIIPDTPIEKPAKAAKKAAAPKKEKAAKKSGGKKGGSKKAKKSEETPAAEPVSETTETTPAADDTATATEAGPAIE